MRDCPLADVCTELGIWLLLKGVKKSGPRLIHTHVEWTSITCSTCLDPCWHQSRGLSHTGACPVRYAAKGCMTTEL